MSPQSFFDIFGGSIGSVAGSVADFGLQALANSVLPMSKAQRQMNEYNSAEAAAARDFSAQQAEIERDWQEEQNAKYNSLQGRIQQAKEAGVNPMLIAGGSAVSPASITGTHPAAPAASGSPASPVGQISDMASAAMGFSKLSAEVKNIKANTRLTLGQAYLTEVRGLYEGDIQQASLQNLLSTAKKMGAETDYFVMAAKEKFANIGKIEAETATEEERKNLIVNQTKVALAEVSNLDIDTKYKGELMREVGHRIDQIDADAWYKAQLAGLAIRQQVTETYNWDKLEAECSWLAADIVRLSKVSSVAEFEAAIKALEVDITEKAKKWYNTRQTTQMVTDVLTSVTSVFGAMKGTSLLPMETNTTSTNTSTNQTTIIDGTPNSPRSSIGFK